MPLARPRPPKVLPATPADSVGLGGIRPASLSDMARSRRFGRWLQNHPEVLERAYAWGERAADRLGVAVPRGQLQKLEGWVRPPEELVKKAVFDCRMCGQCVLHSTGMTCPMTCPKEIRNGPCGGVRQNGHCEVNPEMRCVWVDAFERSQNMPVFGSEIIDIQLPVDRRLTGRSTWVAQMTGDEVEVPAGWLGGHHEANSD